MDLLLSHADVLFVERIFNEEYRNICGGGIRKVLNLSQRLLVPFVVTIGCIIMTQAGIQIARGETIQITHVMGPLWFLPAMWWAKVTTGGINSVKQLERYILPIGICIGLLAYGISLFWMEDKVFLIQGLCAVPFIAIGQWCKTNNVPKWLVWVSIVAWIGAICFSSMNMRACEFGCWPLDIIGACGGTYVLYKIIDRVNALDYTWLKSALKPLAWIGRFSLAVLCAHGLEWKALLPLEELVCGGIGLLVMRFLITMIIAVVLVYTPGLKKIYA